MRSMISRLPRGPPRQRSKVSEEFKQVISGLIHELSRLGIGITLEVVTDGLSLDAAKRAEARLIKDLLKSGAPLVNALVLDGGRSGVVNHHTPGSFEYVAVQREADRTRQREKYATPEGRTRELARQALADLKKGCSLTPMRRYHIESAGRIEDARAIIEARGDAWPEGEVTSR